MSKWSWLPAGPTKRLHVKVKPLKLEGLCVENNTVDASSSSRERMFLIVKMKWIGPKSGSLVPFYKASTCHKNYSRQKFLRSGEGVVEWDDEFESICNFWVAKDKSSFGPWDVKFNILQGEEVQSKTKLAELGNVSLDIAELASSMESQIERKLPISLKINGVVCDAMLLVNVSFAEVRNSDDPPGIVQNSEDSSDGKGRIFRKVKSLATSKKEKQKEEDANFCNSDESSAFNSENESMPTSGKSNAELSSGAGMGLETLSESANKIGLFPRKRRQFSLAVSRRKKEPSIEKINDASEDKMAIGSVQKGKACNGSYWELKEVISRDGQARLKTNVFFSSFDQRSEKAAGESACTALVIVIAHWLHSNQDLMPTTSQFDSLIAEGSSEWRKLCDNEVYANSFHDNHFDLETVLKADIRPLTIGQDKSFTGIFSPEKFENAKGAKSFDDIWKEISSSTEDYEQMIYILSWNDHFFVLKVEADAFYIIDSLGERLFEGCNQAYILKFDDSTLMYRNEVSADNAAGTESIKDQENPEDIICKGKDCCNEFIKRFLAAIPLRELEEEEKKGTVPMFSLLQRLQIDFHYCSTSTASSSSSSLASSASSLFSSDELE